MTLTDAMDISGYTNPRLTFRTKFDIESNWDFGQVDVSTNDGVTWIPLAGEYTEAGVGSFQPTGEPVYDGIISNWVEENISLANYLSSEFKIRFQLESDGGVREDGWYVDDIGILIYTIPTSSQDDAETVTQFELEQNYPNPFNPSTKIKYSIPSNLNRETSNVSLKVYDVLGNAVATLVNEQKPAGTYEVEFDASNLSSGIYFYRLAAGSRIQTKKLILLK
jgi:bacillopeptidase F (M6 metalloprotease family)